MKFIIATHNMKKQAEMQRILSPLGVEVLTAEMAGVTLTDVEETGATIADDSGLSVEFLGGEPGV